MMRSTWLPRRCYFGAAGEVVEIRVFISSSEAPQTTQEILDLLFAPNLQERRRMGRPDSGSPVIALGSIRPPQTSKANADNIENPALKESKTVFK
jgi:hypothetical protein